MISTPKTVACKVSPMRNITNNNSMLKSFTERAVQKPQAENKIKNKKRLRHITISLGESGIANKPK